MSARSRPTGDADAPRIVGTGMTPFGRHPESSLRALALAAAGEALDDAGLAAADVDVAVFGNAAEGVLTGQEMIRGQAALRELGLGRAAVLNVENACASGASALQVACAYVRAGLAEVALAVGAERLTGPDRRRTIAAYSAAADLGEMPALAEQVDRDLLGIGVRDGAGAAHSAMMDIYAALAARFFAEGGATLEDAAAVAVKNRRHAALNPLAQFREPTTVAEVLAGRMVAAPLRLLMCSPIADGAAAAVVCAPSRAGRLDVPAVAVLASVARTGGHRRVGEPGVIARSAAAAYEAARLGPRDLDVIELHDASAPAELMAYEGLGLCPPGGAGALLASGATALGGALPVNPSGGLLSRGHPIGATGLGQIVELCDQLRGRCDARQVPDARIALAQTSGGHLGGEEAVSVVTVLAGPSG